MINYYLLINCVILFFAIVFFSPWSLVAGILAFLNVYGQYKIMNGEVF